MVDVKAISKEERDKTLGELREMSNDDLILLIRLEYSADARHKVDTAKAELSRRLAENVANSVDRFNKISTFLSWTMIFLTLVIVGLTVIMALSGGK